jgi:hypothetical protein
VDLKTEVVYNGRDNTVDLVFKEDGESINHGLLTRIVLRLVNGSTVTTIDSNDSPEAFDWTGGKVVMSLGSLGVTPNTTYDGTFILYDNANTNGIVWTPVVPFAFKEG